MATTADYLNKLIIQKNALADNLVTKGVTATHDETLETLVPKVLDISNDSSFTYGENIFDFESFKTKLSALSQPVMNGTVTWLDNGFTLTASSADCYTWFADGTAPYFEVAPNKDYEISCDVSGSTGHIYIFFEYPPTTNQMIYYSNSCTKFTFRTLCSTKKITLRFGVQKAGNSCTYSNIKIRQIL